MKKLFWLLLLVAFVLGWRLWSSPSGLLRVFILKKHLVLQQQKNQELAAKNAVIQQQIDQLQQQNAALEARAREDLGMIKPGETLYHITN